MLVPRPKYGEGRLSWCPGHWYLMLPKALGRPILRMQHMSRTTYLARNSTCTYESTIPEDFVYVIYHAHYIWLYKTEIKR